MATDLGKVGIVMRGDWSNSSAYDVLDTVKYNNGTYIAKQNVPAGTDPTNSTYWQLAVSVPFDLSFRRQDIPDYSSKTDLECLEYFIDSMPTDVTRGYLVQMYGGADFTAYVQKLVNQPTISSAICFSYTNKIYFLRRQGGAWSTREL